MTTDSDPAKVRMSAGLGPLPPCARSVIYNESKGYSFDAYTAYQMRVYAAEQVVAERARIMTDLKLLEAGNALRLAVKLGMKIEAGFIRDVSASLPGIDQCAAVELFYDADDKLDAVCRAIVRAAAADVGDA